MIIYADITFINNFLMTVAIIWTIAKIMEISFSWKKLISGGLAANIYLFLSLIMYSQKSGPVIFLQVILNLFSAYIIVKISFPGLNNKGYLKLVFYLYLVSFITIGTTISLIYLSGGSSLTVTVQRLIIGIIILLIIANFGWKIFRRYKAPEEFLLPLTIQFRNKSIHLTGLLDTGNSLTDPVTHLPVVVVDQERLLDLFSDQLREELLNPENDYIDLLQLLSEKRIPEKLRLLPFSDLGRENGILIGFRPDFIEIGYREKNIRRKNSIIAISKRKLDYDDEYQALIHPQLL